MGILFNTYLRHEQENSCYVWTRKTEFLVKKYLFDFKSNEETNKPQQTVREIELIQNLENEDLKKICGYIHLTYQRSEDTECFLNLRTRTHTCSPPRSYLGVIQFQVMRIVEF